MLAAERGAAALTLAAYHNDLSDLAGFLAARGAALEAADPAGLHSYVAGPTTARLAPRTLARRISAMRQFYKFLLIEGLRQDDPTAELDTPRLGRPLPKVLSETEVKALIDAAGIWPGDGFRLRCIFEVLYATGLRISGSCCSLPRHGATRVSRWYPARRKERRPTERTGPAGPAPPILSAVCLSRTRPPAGSSRRAVRRASDATAPRSAVEELAIAAGLNPVGCRRMCCAAPREPFARPWRRSAHGAADAGRDIVTTEIYTHVLTD